VKQLVFSFLKNAVIQNLKADSKMSVAMTKIISNFSSSLISRQLQLIVLMAVNFN